LDSRRRRQRWRRLGVGERDEDGDEKEDRKGDEEGDEEKVKKIK
jgi:hypothetical protein